MDPKKLNDQEALEKFVDQLIKEKNSPYVNESNKKEIKEMLKKDISDAINRKMIAELNDSQVDELNKLLDRNATDDEISKFFNQYISNVEQIITEALIDFRKGYLSVVYSPSEASAKEGKPSEKKDETLPAPPLPID